MGTGAARLPRPADRFPAEVFLAVPPMVARFTVRVAPSPGHRPRALHRHLARLRVAHPRTPRARPGPGPRVCRMDRLRRASVSTHPPGHGRIRADRGRTLGRG
ncbi:MAG: hypothetical protein WAK82_10155 [Streptosporangiaceae bacterium]